MKDILIRIALCANFILLLVACNPVDAPSLPDEPLSSPIPHPVSGTQTEPEKESTQMSQPTPSTGMESLVEKAKEDLAQRLSIDVTQISLVEAKEVVWPDASLGCPQPGMRYKQVPEDGALIVLEAQGTTYDYHNGGSRGLFLCEKVVSNPEKPPQIDITNLTPQILDKNNPSPTTPDNSIPPGEDQ